MQNVINNTVANKVIHDNIKKAHAKLANNILQINKVHIENNTVNNTSKKTHKKLFNNVLKQIKSFNKVHIRNNTASNTSKKTHKKLFNNVLKQIKIFNKVPRQDIIFDHDKCKKLHKELFKEVLIELLYTKSAGHKDSSANVNKAHANDVKHANSLLHNHITYYFNKIKKIERTLSEHNKHILTSLSKRYSDNRIKLNEFKKVNDKLNLLLEGICLFMFNKKIKKESIVENVNVFNSITEHTALIDNKRVCLGEIHEYLYENINDIHDNIKNKKYQKVLTSLLLIQKHTFMSINRMRIHNVDKKIAAANNTKKNDMNDIMLITLIIK